MNFTTKKGNQGLGLTNLDELVHLNENVFLETKIENNRFIQIITISGMRG
ncbi:GHKL domain-containing protein [Enterococcus hirae]|nr:GHKL domain-containing protein [Enterococcus hirae]MDV7798881.1 GHKL domain-containing protein [Enterococcus hirae]MDY5309202.1 GHKL domain-containing protein [Enterococcus hirae]